MQWRQKVYNMYFGNTWDDIKSCVAVARARLVQSCRNSMSTCMYIKYLFRNFYKSNILLVSACAFKTTNLFINKWQHLILINILDELTTLNFSLRFILL